MRPIKINRQNLRQLTDLPNVGPACAKDLAVLGITRAEQLVGLNPFEMYENLCLLTGQRHDPCVIDVFMSITEFMAGHPPQDWWAFTVQRKAILMEKKS